MELRDLCTAELQWLQSTPGAITEELETRHATVKSQITQVDVALAQARAEHQRVEARMALQQILQKSIHLQVLAYSAPLVTNSFSY